ncbi:FAD-dependent oxidoreductase [Nocardia terpenica]|uniref:ferredoxin--NADP(+) reductase n=1 Tax=Nocardia terpenica TaxID=455432 RepID=A0A291RPM3_9NOCA|nr:FAD-dependent oxidoreductase [Nocardia terpenica]ATL69218.1 ferredoxin [Nocardia terpenica]
MAYVITQPCCNDASCIPECPVDCIRPTPDQPEFATTEMLYIDPATCIDCGSCVDACPVDAIYSEDDLPETMRRYTRINADYFLRHPLQPDITSPLPSTRSLPKGHETLRVAIVGAGPSACYAAHELLKRGNVEINVLERLPTPWGLVRAGVAPDHPKTKRITELFESIFATEAVQCYLNVTVGTHVSLAELLNHHHAVIYAVGASASRRLGIPGEELPGSHSAIEFVAWYNGHPDYADHAFDLSGKRAVIVGNGNVALDVARILTTDPAELSTTDIADYALEALRHSNIREIVILGRRTPVQASYTCSEFLALGYLPDVEIVLDESEIILDPASQAVIDDPAVEPSQLLKLRLAQEYARGEITTPRGHKRIVLRYLVSPVAYHGQSHIEAIEIARNEMLIDHGEPIARPTRRIGILDTSLVLRSIGHRGEPITDLPFDERRGVVPNEHGRVLGADHRPMVGVYVTGWIKRGARGVLGANRADAEETIEQLVADFVSGALTTPSKRRAALTDLLAKRQPDMINRAGWQAIDAAERAEGAATGRPRVKLTSINALVHAARRRGGTPHATVSAPPSGGTTE